jgi:hypothetical protein
MLKKTGFNNSGLALNQKTGGYDINVLLSRHNLKPISAELINHFVEVSEKGSDTDLQKAIMRFANVLYSAVKLNSEGMKEKQKSNDFYSWIDKLEKFMKNKTQEIPCEDDDDYDVRSDVFFQNFYPKAFKEFLRNNPKP